MNSSEIMDAAIQLKPVDRVPNAPFYEAPICRYFGADFRSALAPTSGLHCGRAGLWRTPT